ncbi:hypothetical protein JCM10213_006531 [Rhodosporidiobolus nylandii]
MRRIFGAPSSLATSSTSSSLNSDALPSPTFASFPEPPHTPTGTSFGGGGGGGWFSGLSRTASTASNAPSAAGSGGQKRPDSPAGGTAGGGGGGSMTAGAAALLDGSAAAPPPLPSRVPEEDDAFAPERLPFGQAARSLSPPLSPPNHARQTSAGSSVAGAGGYARPFSPEGVLAASFTAGEGAARVKTDDMMVELLSGQAVIEAREFEVLEWEEVQRVKKDLTALSSRLTSLTRSLALETRLRDSAAKLVRLSASTSSSSSSRPLSPSPLSPRPASPSSSSAAAAARPRASKEQAEQQLATAQEKVQRLEAEHGKLAAKEGELRTRLLRHTAAVLALSLRHKEDGSATARSPSLLPLDPSHANGQLQTPKAFDAPHFFASSASVRSPSSSTRPARDSPYASPSLSSSAGFGAAPATTALQHDLSAAEQRTRELETELAALRASSSASAAELAQLRESLASAQAANGDKAQRLEKLLKEAEVDKAEAEQRASAVEARMGQLEGELEAARETHLRERADLERRAEEAARAPPASTVEEKEDDSAAERVRELEQQATALRQSIGDVLRRHRTRPLLGPVLREGSPSFDDSPSSSPNPDLAASVGKTLDAHFAALAAHVEGLQRRAEEAEEAAATRARGEEEGREELEREAQELRERVEQAEGDLASLSLERDSLQLELDDARAALPELEARLSASAASSADLAAAQNRLAELERELDTREAERAKLEDLWASLPVSGGALPSRSPQMSSARTKVGGFLADVASKATAAVTSSSSMSSLTSNASSSPSTSPSLSFSPLPGTAERFSAETLVERVRGLVSEGEGLRRRLQEVEGEMEALKGREREGEEWRGKVKDLEERIEVSAGQEVQMLERLNDLTESLESSRSSSRQLQQRIAQLESELAAAQAAASSAPPSSSGYGDDGEVQELRDQIQDLEEELEDARRREQKTRSSLLEELSTAQNEVSSLKTQLRQAQRRAGAGAGAGGTR